jgi:hypothetical protein
VLKLFSPTISNSHVLIDVYFQISYDKKAGAHEDHCQQNGRPLLGFASG